MVSHISTAQVHIIRWSIKPAWGATEATAEVVDLTTRSSGRAHDAWIGRTPQRY